MFQRTLLRQSQAVKAVLSSSYSKAPVAVRTSSRLQPQLSQPLARQPVFRFYSTENKSGNGEQKEGGNGNGKEAGKENGATEAQESPEDALRKELEEKKKEAADLKVITTFPTMIY